MAADDVPRTPTSAPPAASPQATPNPTPPPAQLPTHPRQHTEQRPDTTKSVQNNRFDENRRATAFDDNEHTLFSVPNLDIAKNASAEEYRQHVRDLHRQMTGGDTSDYFESKIPLPRSLQGLKTGQVVTKLLALNPTLDSSKWAAVTADVVGVNLIIGTVSKEGRKMIDELVEMKVEPGRSTKVPAAAKPNNLYYVELLLPYERELHVDLMEAFLIKFPTGKFVSMPGKRPWGTTRRVRLFFNTTTAPNEVFIDNNNTNPPIREITLECGTAAQVIHKWQRLNQHRPPHLTNKWSPVQPNPNRSYAAAAANGTNPTQLARVSNEPSPNGSPRTASVGTGNINNPQPAPTASHQRNNPPPPPQPNDQMQTDNIDWATNEPLTTPNQNIGPNQEAESSLRMKNQNTQHTLTPTPNMPLPAPQTPTPTSNSPTTINNQTRHPTRTPKNKPTHSAPTPDLDEASEWQQVKRLRTRKSQHPITKTAPPGTQALQRSSSKNRKQKGTNKFSLLDFEITPTFEDDSIAPIEVLLPTRPTRPPRRTYQQTRRAMTKPLVDAASHTQELRHPAHILQHMSPRHAQVILRSTNPSTKLNREKLLNQIALLRAVRTNTTPDQILLDKYDDQSFITQIQSRVSKCSGDITCSHLTPTDIPMRAVLDDDETRVRSARCFTWIDLATRALLPHLYDIWPDEPKWNNRPLKWLPATDKEVPCLEDESLAALAACPTLQNVWAHIATTSPELSAALNTAANQWHLYMNDASRHLTPIASTPSHQES